MGIPLRKLWSYKPKQLGPPEVVQRNIRMNAERAGIDPGQFRFYAPCWEQAGQKIYDYSRYQNHMPVAGAKWAKNQLYLDSTTGSVSDGSLKPTGEHTLISKFEYHVSMPEYSGSLVVFDAGSIDGYDIRIDDLGTQTIEYRNRANASILAVGYNHFVGIPETLAGVYVPSTAGYLYKNGVLIGSDDSVDASIDYGTYGTQSLVLGASGLNILIDYVLFASEAYTPSQIAHLSDNPYFLLQRNPARTYFVPSESGSTLLPINFNQQKRISHTNIRR